MRDANNTEDVVTSRLWAVLAATPDPVRDQTVPPSAISTAVASSWDELSASGEPLSWSDVISGWPDDIDLDPDRDPPGAPGPSPRAAPKPGPDAADPPHAGEPAGRPPPDLAPAGSASTLPAVAGNGSGPLASEEVADVFGPPWSVPPRSVAQGFVAQGGWLAESRSAWPAEAWDAPAEAAPASDPLVRLSGAGAFDSGRRDRTSAAGAARLSVFDPGRRGVRALAAVAVVVVLIAGVLAWRSRPRVDPVAVPAVEVGAAADGADDRPARAGAPAVGGPAAPSGSTEVVVAVGGKVRKPGLVRLPAGSRVADALQAAGGAVPGVEVALLNLARKVVDGELILVGVTPPPGLASGGGSAGTPGGGTSGGAAPGGLVNLNTATLADLDTLPGVGPVLAQRILAARDAQGGFRAVTDLRKVDGIGDARYEQLKGLVTV